MRITGSMSSRSLVSRTGRVRQQLGRSFERVASGKRINSGRDDAAGLAISARMKAQSVSLRRTGLNMQDGEALARVADTGLSGVTNLLIRMRELAVQAANSTNTAQDRQSLQKEIDQVLEEIDRVSTQTEIFGRTPLQDPFATEVHNPPERVDVAFLVDNSRSMGPKIDNLKLAINNFKSRLEEVSDDIRFGLMVVGKGNDRNDAARRLADIGDPDFNAQLAPLNDPINNGLNGSAMDSHYATLEAVKDTVNGIREPDLFSFGDDAKRLILLTDTSALEGARATGDPVDPQPAPTEQDVKDALDDAGVTADVIHGNSSADFELMTRRQNGTNGLYPLGTRGEGVAAALNAIAAEITEIPEDPLTNEPEIQTGVHAGQTTGIGVPVDAHIQISRQKPPLWASPSATAPARWTPSPRPTSCWWTSTMRCAPSTATRAGRAPSPIGWSPASGPRRSPWSPPTARWRTSRRPTWRWSPTSWRATGCAWRRPTPRWPAHSATSG